VSPRVRANATTSSISLSSRVIDTIAALVAATISEETTLDPEMQKQNAVTAIAWYKSMIDFLSKNDIYATHEPYYPDVVSRTLIVEAEPTEEPAPSLT
jgi:hypothetical protein